MHTATLRGGSAKTLVKYIKTHNQVRVKIVSASMSPVIVPGDCVMVDRLERKLWPGDIALCYSNNCFYVHRFILGWAGRYYFRGDSAHSFDSSIQRRDIVGLVTKIQSASGKDRRDFMKPIIVVCAWALFLVRKIDL